MRQRHDARKGILRVGRKPKGSLKPAMPGMALDPRALAEPRELRDRLLQLRVTASELAEIHETARSLGLTMTAYVIGLHRQAVATLAKRGGR